MIVVGRGAAETRRRRAWAIFWKWEYHFLQKFESIRPRDALARESRGELLVVCLPLDDKSVRR